MNETNEWAGTTAIVTGAGSGIGASTAALLALAGVTVVGVDLDENGLSKTAAMAEGAEGDFRPFVGDVCDEEVQLEALAVGSPAGHLDFLVNNAAVFLLAGVSATRFQWDRTLAVNLVAGAEFVSRAVPFLRKAPRPAVVNVASISAHVGQGDRWTYNSAKAGVIELTRCQALDLPDIRFNTVSPGWIWTETLERASEGDREKWEPIWGAYCPQNRCGEPIEVAEAIKFLLSRAASFITGADLPVDGGYLATSSEGPAVLQLGK
jgi:NAD(P)-dependent dehydrogenase (short-subunit alcohol dehydrogenase family)